jgi:diguanylate cyclase (GGDEF)-like protein/PAS domain S-box-containing protein
VNAGSEGKTDALLDAQRLDAARVATLFAFAKSAYPTALALAGILVASLWGLHAPAILLAWFAALTGVTFLRVALHWRHARAKPVPADAARWENRFAVGALASGAAWAFVPAVLFPQGDPILQLAVILIIAGAAVGVAGVYAPSAKSVYAFGALPLAAVIVQLALQPFATHRLLAVAVAVFAVVMARLSQLIRRGMIATLRANLRNEELVERVSASHSQLRDAIASFPEGIAIWDTDDCMVVCNASYARVYGGGLGPDELVGAPFRRVAENAYGLEQRGPDSGERREEWVGRRVAAHAKGDGVPQQYQTRDGHWYQRSTTRMSSGGWVGLVADITALKRAQEAYLSVLAEENLMLDTLPVGVAFVERGIVVRCNRRLEQILGCEEGGLEGKSTRAWFGSEDRWQSARDEVYSRLQAGEILDADARLVRKDGQRLWCRVLARALDPRAPEESAIFTLVDVDQRVAAERALKDSEEMLRLAVDAANLYYWEWDAVSDQLRWGRQPGMELQAGTDRTWRGYAEIVHPEDRERYLEVGREAAERGRPFEIEYRVNSRDGRSLWLAARGAPMRDAAGRFTRMIGISQDITERKQREEMVRFLAYHDSLTGLPNRRLLDDRLKQALYQAQRRDASIAVMLVDLDDFKQVNDTAGHRSGDAVLREVATRLGSCVRKADTLARHGGDEFVIVLPDIQGEADCRIVAEKVLRALDAEFRVDASGFKLGASIGISVFPGDAGDPDSLLRNADAAMYRAKQLGRNQYRFYGR